MIILWEIVSLNDYRTEIFSALHFSRNVNMCINMLLKGLNFNFIDLGVAGYFNPLLLLNNGNICNGYNLKKLCNK